MPPYASMSAVLAVIYNPASHGFHQDQVQKAQEYFELHNRAAEFYGTESPSHATEIVNSLLKGTNSPSMIAGMGGDGTLNEIVQSLVKTEVPMGIIPTGTANVLARDLGIPQSIEEACEILVSGTAKSIPVGKIIRKEPADSRYFLLVCGAGWDGLVCKSVNPTIKNSLGKGAYALETLKTIVQANLEHFDVHTAEETFLASTMIASVTGHYGGNLPITPDASPFDEKFHIFMLKSRSRRAMVELFGRISLGKLESMKGMMRSSSAEISIHRPGIPLQIDGDYYGETPASIERIPNALRVICPVT